MGKAVVNNEYAGKEKSEKGIYSDVLGSQHWEDAQQSKGNGRTRKGLLLADNGYKIGQKGKVMCFNQIYLSIRGS